MTGRYRTLLVVHDVFVIDRAGRYLCGRCVAVTREKMVTVVQWKIYTVLQLRRTEVLVQTAGGRILMMYSTFPQQGNATARPVPHEHAIDGTLVV